MSEEEDFVWALQMTAGVTNITEHEAVAADAAMAAACEGEPCEGCPPDNYPTDKTRCLECPRHHAIKYEVQIPGYGRFQISAESREQAEAYADQKRRWEGAMNMLVWRSDCSTEYDQLTADVADEFARGNGVSVKYMRARKRARNALPSPKTLSQ